MSRLDRVPCDLADAAGVQAARDAILLMVGSLAVSTLEEQAISRLKAAPERVQSSAVRRAIRRWSRPGESRPPLREVSPIATDRTAGAPAEPALLRSGQFIAPALASGGAA